MTVIPLFPEASTMPVRSIGHATVAARVRGDGVDIMATGTERSCTACLTVTEARLFANYILTAALESERD